MQILNQESNCPIIPRFGTKNRSWVAEMEAKFEIDAVLTEIGLFRLVQ